MNSYNNKNHNNNINNSYNKTNDLIVISLVIYVIKTHLDIFPPWLDAFSGGKNQEYVSSDSSFYD